MQKTKRLKAEEVKEAKEYAENIIETVREPLIILNGKLKVISANNSFYRGFKVSKKETVGKKLYNICNRQWNMPKLRTLLEKILPKKTTFEDFEVSHKFETIGERFMILNAREIKREAGKERLILLAIEDITERKLIERAVQKASDYAKSVINTIREPLLVLDRALRVVSASRSFYQTFKVTPKETEGEFIYDLGNRQWNMPKLRTLLENILQKKAVIEDFEVEHDFETIGKRTMLLNARRIPPPPAQPERILLAIEDITTKKQAQEKLIRLEKLATMGKLAGIIGHELRDSLGVIRNSGYFLKKNLKGSNEKAKEQLNIVDAEIESANRLITNILEFSKTKPFILKKEQINNIVKEVISKAAIPSNVKVHMALEENIPKANVAKEQIKQVFKNIISNAIDAMPKGGELTIITKKVNAFIQVAFKDTGIGIEKENLSKIFEPLVSFKLQGSGLGLATCKTIVDNNNGRIKAESTKGKGATFTVILPIKNIYKKLKNQFVK